MDDITKMSAQHKAEAIIQKIGYPEYILKPKELDETYKGVNSFEQLHFTVDKVL